MPIAAARMEVVLGARIKGIENAWLKTGFDHQLPPRRLWNLG
jgi:hypothetical protein